MSPERPVIHLLNAPGGWGRPDDLILHVAREDGMQFRVVLSESDYFVEKLANAVDYRHTLGSWGLL